MNETLALIEARSSTRAFADVPIGADEGEAVLHAAMRAPTGGNMMLYSIIEIEDRALKDALAIACDDQPFIARAPWVLLFVADFQKWVDLWAASNAASQPGLDRGLAPGPGDLMLACSDALIAAQTAVIAAESLGIGSCYIGDIMENAEEVMALLELPPHTFPIAMLVFGRPAAPRPPQPRYEKHVVHRNRYRRLSPDELAEAAADLGAMFSPHGLPEGVADYPQAVYRRKYASAFMAEMNRSVGVWLERWQTEESR